MQTTILGCGRKAPLCMLAGAAFVAGVSALGLVVVGRQGGRHRSKDGENAPPSKLWIDSPRKSQIPGLSPHEAGNLPYPEDVLPGRRDVETPYGSIRVFEWGPGEGERVLLLHGIGTPCLALGGIAHTLVESGYRVMLFDFFGRGYSDAPKDLPFDLRLYSAQILLVLASSSVSWSGDDGFHLMGYSLGGGVAASFASYFPRMLRSLTLVAGGGLIRYKHVGWQSKLLYSSSSGILPAWLLESLVRWRLMPVEPTFPGLRASTSGVVQPEGNHDASGGDSFDSAMLPSGATVASVMEWQLRHHEGFARAFRSSMQNAPIYERRQDWQRLASRLAERRQQNSGGGTSSGDKHRQQLEAGLKGGKVLLVLGESDPVIVKDELVQDVTELLGPDGFQTVVLDVGHEIAIVQGPEVARAAMRFWQQAPQPLNGLASHAND